MEVFLKIYDDLDSACVALRLLSSRNLLQRSLQALLLAGAIVSVWHSLILIG